MIAFMVARGVLQGERGAPRSCTPTATADGRSIGAISAQQAEQRAAFDASRPDCLWKNARGVDKRGSDVSKLNNRIERAAARNAHGREGGWPRLGPAEEHRDVRRKLVRVSLSPMEMVALTVAVV